MNITTTTTDKLDIPEGETVHFDTGHIILALCGSGWIHASNYAPDVTCPDCLELLGGNEPSRLTKIDELQDVTQEDWEQIKHMLHLAQIRRERMAVLKVERDRYKDAYENMRQFAQENGLDTTTTGETEDSDG